MIVALFCSLANIMYYVRTVHLVKQNAPTVEQKYWSGDVQWLEVLFKDLALWKTTNRYLHFLYNNVCFIQWLISLRMKWCLTDAPRCQSDSVKRDSFSLCLFYVNVSHIWKAARVKLERHDHLRRSSDLRHPPHERRRPPHTTENKNTTREKNKKRHMQLSGLSRCWMHNGVCGGACAHAAVCRSIRCTVALHLLVCRGRRRLWLNALKLQNAPDFSRKPS